MPIPEIYVSPLNLLKRPIVLHQLFFGTDVCLFICIHNTLLFELLQYLHHIILAVPMDHRVVWYYGTNCFLQFIEVIVLISLTNMLCLWRSVDVGFAIVTLAVNVGCAPTT